MANKGMEIKETILSMAEEEFLCNGYEKASMRRIADKAGVTTGALYSRFPNKNALFSSLVETVADSYLAFVQKGNVEGEDYLLEGRPQDIWSLTEKVIKKLVTYIYEHKTAFVLLINKSVGSSYEDFLERMILTEEENTYQYLQKLKSYGYSVQSVSRADIHVLVTAQYNAVFEIIRHETTEEEAFKRLLFIANFFNLGWSRIFGLKV